MLSSAVGVTELSDTQAFDRLDELLAQLPAMEEQGRRLAVAREARQLRALEVACQALVDKWSLINAECAALMAEERQLRETEHTSEKRYEVVVGKIRYLAEHIALRRAPVARAQEALKAALETGSLALADPLDELALSDDEFARLEAGIAAYQREFVTVLERCQKLEFKQKSGRPPLRTPQTPFDNRSDKE
ncbi:MAG: hypothetical protein LBU31_04115 [Coriobacteriales bacterium]|nr:hypothetical protein [Coriobacteriales bacterium]